MKKVQANRWIPFLVFCWGVVTTLTGVVQNFGGLVAVRFVLGMCEGGLLPGIVSGVRTDMCFRCNKLSFRFYI
jgi:MFS family permease